MNKIGIRLGNSIGIGDAIQFSSLPENYFLEFGDRLVDIESNWIFDHNPFVVRNVQKVERETDLWGEHCNNVKKSYRDRNQLLANAEASCALFNLPMRLNRPRLYRFESYPFHMRTKMILQTRGKSHGQLPSHIINHVFKKYGYQEMVWLAAPGEVWSYDNVAPPQMGPFESKWDLVENIATARMLIGPDSGPAWIAQCYSDIIVKKVRMTPSVEALHDWVPLEWCRIGSHWDDRSASIYNPSEYDAGMTWSYKRI